MIFILLCGIIFLTKGDAAMPNIIPISNLRNYSSVLDSVAVGSPVYLTKTAGDAMLSLILPSRKNTKKPKLLFSLCASLTRAGSRAKNRVGKIFPRFAGTLLLQT